MQRVLFIGVSALALVLWASPIAGARPRPAEPRAGFAKPIYVDRTLAGGEPVLLNTGKKGTLIYSTHQGTTHLYRNGLVAPSFATFLATDRDQVYIWISKTNGKTWQLVNLDNTGVTSAYANGFSDPDLTMDEGGTVYDTGINLVNDSVFGSTDGGESWMVGTPDCHDGDRPWLAGGKAGHVYMSTDTVEGSLSHQVFEGTVLPTGQIQCSTSGVPDTDGSTYSGDGKLYYDHHNGNIVEPAIFLNKNGGLDGFGVSIAQSYGKPFVPHEAADTRMFAHWPAIAIDAADNIYLVWDTDPRSKKVMNGCPDSNGNPTPGPRPNAVKMAVSSDHGKTWKVFTVAHPPHKRVLWPWVTAGDGGKASVVWYQLDRIADSDCQPAKTYIYEANVFGAPHHKPRIAITNGSGRYIHNGQICQGGTTCVATGQDRRLGDFFTNAVDLNGCVIIASGDTRLKDSGTGGPLATSRPIFIRQNSGPKLMGHGRCH